MQKPSCLKHLDLLNMKIIEIEGYLLEGKITYNATVSFLFIGGDFFLTLFWFSYHIFMDSKLKHKPHLNCVTSIRSIFCFSVCSFRTTEWTICKIRIVFFCWYCKARFFQVLWKFKQLFCGFGFLVNRILLPGRNRNKLVTNQHKDWRKNERGKSTEFFLANWMNRIADADETKLGWLTTICKCILRKLKLGPKSGFMNEVFSDLLWCISSYDHLKLWLFGNVFFCIGLEKERGFKESFRNDDCCFARFFCKYFYRVIVI